MENLPEVCVIMPVYNGASTIRLALKSLLAQTYTNWNCVIVNDGSTDGTKVILDSLIDPRFKVYHLARNMGRGYARQYALEHAEGDYLAFLDSDDFFHTDKIKVQVQEMVDDSTMDLIATEVLVYDDNFNAVGKRTKDNVEKTFYKLGEPLKISMATAMIRLKKAVKISYNQNLDSGEDVDFLSRYLNNGYYKHMPHPYYFYYVSNKNTPYKKILHYTAHNVKRGIYMLRSASVISALKVIIKASFKWILYAVLLPVLGENFFIRRRNVPISDGEKIMYEQQLSIINKIKI